MLFLHWYLSYQRKKCQHRTLKTFQMRQKKTQHWSTLSDRPNICNAHSQQWDLTFDTKNQFLDPELVGFGSLNVKIGLELSKLWYYWFSIKSPYFFLRNYYINCWCPAHLIVIIIRGQTGVGFTWHIYRQLQPNARLSMITFPKIDTP